MSTKVLDKYKEHQLKWQKASKDKSKPAKHDNTAKWRPYNTRSIRAKVKIVIDMLIDILDIDEQNSSSSDEFEDTEDEESTTSSKNDEWHMPRVNMISTDKDASNTASNPPLPEPPPELEVEMQKWATDICALIIDTTNESNKANDNTTFVKPIISKLVSHNEI